MTVVPVLMTSCQVSEYPKIGPVIIQIRMVRKANRNAVDEPVTCVAFEANRSNGPAFGLVNIGVGN